MEPFYAKILSYNLTTYPTNTLSVLTREGERRTLRIDEDEPVEEAEVYRFETTPIEFKGRTQYRVDEYRHITDCELSIEERFDIMRDFYPFAPVELGDIKETIEAYLERLEEETIRTVTQTLYARHKEDFYLYPAATKFHHAYIGGVAYHTATMLKLAEGLLDAYPFLDAERLIAGIVLHDLFKTVELSNYYAPEYTSEGRLLGHISIGAEAIAAVAREQGLFETEERMLLQHMLLSHHYHGNFGSPKRPAVPEALALHFIDNIDSKFTVLGEALEEIEPGTFTSNLGVLDRERYYKPKRPPRRKK